MIGGFKTFLAVECTFYVHPNKWQFTGQLLVCKLFGFQSIFDGTIWGARV